jgi:hypothetical protein
VTVLLPQVKRGVLSILLDFLYTGTMQVRFFFVPASVGDPDPDLLVRCNVYGSGSFTFLVKVFSRLK